MFLFVFIFISIVFLIILVTLFISPIHFLCNIVTGNKPVEQLYTYAKIIFKIGIIFHIILESLKNIGLNENCDSLDDYFVG